MAMTPRTPDPPRPLPHEARFFCDAMLGGLARWLRAAGYDAEFEYGIDDGVMVRRAARSGRIILSSDGPLFERKLITSGEVPALFVPRGLRRLEQLEFVLRQFHLPLLAPRCMACGGELVEVPRHSIMDEAPPLAFRNCRQFWRCDRCGKLLWQGTHWQKVSARLAELMKPQTPQ